MGSLNLSPFSSSGKNSFAQIRRNKFQQLAQSLLPGPWSSPFAEILEGKLCVSKERELFLA